jgi:phospholipase A-2-activating protein
LTFIRYFFIFVFIDTAVYFKFLEKLKEFNLKQKNENQSVLDESLESVVKLATIQNEEIIDSGTINTFISLLHWPDSIVFPVLDIARLAVLQANVNDKLCTDEFFELLKQHLRKDAMAANQMLTFRLLANMFLHETGEKLCLRYKNDLLKFILHLTSPLNKNTQVYT